ncbi:MAG TPA: Stk1 family PASTA domain-containing Ser/Thr kinase [Acidothermaceae bacterium]|jgi:serine/threonine protein kinase|nr:Stk1 family PASTA domain-containing Ser/Thr kinase [Acidothermaceae bacterium]
MTEPRRLGDRYELGEVLGYGGMAEVHRGRDIRLGRDVAVKTLRVDLAREPSFQARFRREAQSAASLNHPAIVAVYDTGESMLDGVPVPYIVMEYVDGRTLRDVLKAERHIMPTRALEITAEILNALDYSHRNGIIHRDIKPANVMLTRSGEVKVMDFGIARSVAQASAAVTQTAAVIGTAQYLSPEQARGEQVDPRSDVYSTGCLLYELLTGTPPFTGDSAVAVAYQHVREDPIPPSRLNLDISPAIDAIVLKAMAKNPVNRYQSAAEMREDIERALSGVPVLATPLLHDQTVSIEPVAVDEFARRQPRGRRSLVYIMVVLIAIGMFILIGVIARHLLETKRPVVTVPVPNVAGFSQADAVATLTNAGLNPVVQPGTSATVAKGVVITENPPQGTPLPRNTNVTIYVSSGPQAVQVPDLTNQSLADAKSELTRDKLVLGTTTLQNSPQSANTVLSQTPVAGATVNSGSAVNVVVANGNSTVPDVRNLPLAEAEQALTSFGFNFQEIDEPSSSNTAGTVINQSPTHDSPAKTGTVVKLFVAVAPPHSSSPPVSPPPTPPPTATPTTTSPSPST